MVSIFLSKDKFDKITKKTLRPDSIHVGFTAKASRPCSVKIFSNRHEQHYEFHGSFIQKTIEMQVSSLVGINLFDIVFACEDHNSVQSKSLVIDMIHVNGVSIGKTHYGMDRVDWRTDDLSCFSVEQRKEYAQALSSNHGGYFGFFGRVRVPYYRFSNIDAARIYKRGDYSVDCGGRYSIIYDDPPTKTKDVLKDV